MRLLLRFPSKDVPHDWSLPVGSRAALEFGVILRALDALNAQIANARARAPFSVFVGPSDAAKAVGRPFGRRPPPQHSRPLAQSQRLRSRWSRFPC
jgi:hypothetical protein